MIKKLQQSDDLFIQFTDEELQKFNLELGQRLDIEVTPDGIKMTPWTKLEIDLETFDRKTLEFLIKESCEKDISVNDVIVDVLRKELNKTK